MFNNRVWYPSQSFAPLSTQPFQPLSIIASRTPLVNREKSDVNDKISGRLLNGDFVPRFERKEEKRTLVRGYDGVQREILAKKAGVRRECWTGEPDKEPTPAEGEEPIFDRTLDQLTRTEFRRLKEQIRDVSTSLGYKFRGSGYQKYVENEDPHLYRSQLSDSLKTFRLQTLKPPAIHRDTELKRCRPIIGTKPICSRPQTAPAVYQHQPRPQRPQSSPAVRPAPEVAGPKYDSLTSDLVYYLANKGRLDSGYGDLSGNEDDSSDEDIPEPEVDITRKIPDFPALRPDPLENLYMSECERDYAKYDFDASVTEIPKYEFKYCGPEEFEKVDFEDLASYGKDWRLMTKRRPKLTELELLIDKFIELERLVVKTEDWEDRRRDRCRQMVKQKQININNLKSQGRRINSARRDKKCCKNCLQVVCAGDCPLKTSAVRFCIHCRQEFCSGTCVHMTYNSHSRMTASESDSDSETTKPVRKQRPKSCQSCRRLDTNTKAINANHILQGRPKSSLATYNRGQSSVETQELIEEDHTCHRAIEKEFKKLNIVPNSRPSTATKRPPRGRAALVPGKSYFSQRHDSISVPKGERVKSAPPRLAGSRVKRVKSAKGRRSRPGTANGENKAPAITNGS